MFNRRLLFGAATLLPLAAQSQPAGFPNRTASDASVSRTDDGMNALTMTKLTFCICRKPGMSFEDFDAHWRKHAKDLRVQRYVQCVTLLNPGAQEGIRASRNAEASPYDGVAELWWKSLDDLAAARRSPEGAEAARILLEDERRFIGYVSSRLWYGTERTVIG